MGRAVYHGDLKPLLPWVLMGQSVHVGKSAVKGDGWYEVMRTSANLFAGEESDANHSRANR